MRVHSAACFFMFHPSLNQSNSLYLQKENVCSRFLPLDLFTYPICSYLTMAQGKQTCKILKEIRRQIAEANEIELVTSECRYRGDCLGTCPKCEAEVRYLEQQLRHRQMTGKAVVLAGVSAGMIALSGCGNTAQKTSHDSDLQGEAIEVLTDSTEQMMEVDSGLCELPMDPVIPEQGEVTEAITLGWVPPGDDRIEGDERGIYTLADEMPEFPGGLAAMMKYIRDNIEYPQEYAEGCVQGRVIVKFYVDTLGQVREPEIVKGVDPPLDREVLRVVGLFPPFTPGRLNGEKVNVWMVIPFVFKLE